MKTEPLTKALWAEAAFSLTLKLFHGAVLAVIVIAYLSITPAPHGA
ncbi:hypothetical protein [uncultured Thiodictyon sp.]|nr:hypothetical protein [uncultured Thiodictyon sp.]